MFKNNILAIFVTKMLDHNCGTIREINWHKWAISISNDILKNQSVIYIYGAGKLGKNIYNYLKYINVKVNSFIVTHSDHVDYIDGIPVLELSPGIIHQNAYYVVAILDEDIQIIICSRLYEMGAKYVLSYIYK